MKHFDYEYRVRYADTDKMGISYYANYFVWFEAARTEYFRALGQPYTECEKQGYYLPVVETSARYVSPSTYDDLIVVRTSVSEVNRTSMKFEYQVLQKETQKLLATGDSRHVMVNRQMKLCALPDAIKKAVSVYSLLEK